MIIWKRRVLLLPLVLANALANASSTAPEPGAVGIQLKAISARTTGKGASLVIEATEPAAYVATRPDPLTIYVDFRNVGTLGVTNRFSNDDKSPIAGVAVETGESLGAPVSRVRVTLAEPVGYSVRSDRNTVIVEVEKRSGIPYVLPPVSRTRPDALSALERPDAPRPDAMAAITAARASEAASRRSATQASAVLAALPQAGAPSDSPVSTATPAIGLLSSFENRFATPKVPTFRKST